MKKMIYTLAVLLGFGLQATAQNDAISRIFNAYENREDVTQISISGKLFEMAGKIEVDEDAEKFKAVAAQITHFRMIVDAKDPMAVKTARAALGKIPADFEELVTIRDKQSEIHLLCEESDGIVHELIAVVGDANNFLIASIRGNMDLNDIGAVTKQLTAVGQSMTNTNLNPSPVLVFPSPATYGEEIQITLPAELEGAKISIFDTSGKELLNFIAKSKSEKLNTGRLGKGVFVLIAQKGDKEVTRKFLIR